MLLTLLLTHKEGESRPRHLCRKGNGVTGNSVGDQGQGQDEVRQARRKASEEQNAKRPLGPCCVARVLGWTLNSQVPEPKGFLHLDVHFDLLHKISKYFPIF